MPKIPALPPMTSPDAADELPIEDVSANTTKYITLTKLKEWFQSLTGFISANTMFAAGVVNTAALGLGAVISEKLDLSSMGILTAWSASNFSTTATSLQSINVVIPTGCTKVLIIGTARLQAQDATSKDIVCYVRYNGATNTQSFYETTSAIYQSANVAVLDIMTVTAGTRSFALFGQTSGGNANSGVGKIFVIPIAA